MQNYRFHQIECSYLDFVIRYSLFVIRYDIQKSILKMRIFNQFDFISRSKLKFKEKPFIIKTKLVKKP